MLTRDDFKQEITKETKNLFRPQEKNLRYLRFLSLGNKRATPWAPTTRGFVRNGDRPAADPKTGTASDDHS